MVIVNKALDNVIANVNHNQFVKHAKLGESSRMPQETFSKLGAVRLNFVVTLFT